MRNFFPQFNMFRREQSTDATATGADLVRQTGAADANKSADYEEHVVRPHGRSSLLVPAWFRGVTLIMQTMAQMRVQYQRLNAAGGNFVEDRYGPTRRLNYLLQVSPNPLMTAPQMLEQIEYEKIYNGNAYVFIERDSRGDPCALYLARDGSYNQITDNYQLTIERRGGTFTITAPSEDVLHFPNVILYDNKITGIPTMVFARQALSIAATADEQTLKDMAKGGKHKILVQEKAPEMATRGLLAAGRANKEEMKKITAQLGEDFLSKDAIFLNNIADAKIISQTAAELRTLENRGFQVSDISRLLGIPTIMMMLDSGKNYKTPEAATQEFLLRTIQPRIIEMEAELNRKLLAPEDFGNRRIHVCEEALRRLDSKQQADLDKVHLETGAMSVNEIRAQYDRGTIPDGDIFYVSTNLAVAGSDKLRSNGGGRPADTQSQSNDNNSDDKTDDNDEEGGEE